MLCVCERCVWCVCGGVCVCVCVWRGGVCVCVCVCVCVVCVCMAGLQLIASCQHLGVNAQ